MDEPESSLELDSGKAGMKAFISQRTSSSFEPSRSGLACGMPTTFAEGSGSSIFLAMPLDPVHMKDQNDGVLA
jgi:hypothetical protein